MYPGIKTASEITPMDMIFAKVFAEAAAKTEKEHGTEGICSETRLYKPGIHTVTFTGRYEDVTRKYNVFLQNMQYDYGNNFRILVQTSVSTYFEECVSITFRCW